jgi:hypothetical protein
VAAAFLVVVAVWVVFLAVEAIDGDATLRPKIVRALATTIEPRFRSCLSMLCPFLSVWCLADISKLLKF